MRRNSPRLRSRMRGCFMFVPSTMVFGMLAAIAIPAYQDYTIRAQTTEGLNLAGIAKAGVAEYYATHGKWPADLAQLGLQQEIRGKYVDSVEVHRGTVVIIYGGIANQNIVGSALTLRPTVDAQGNVVWSCGYAVDQGQDPRTGAAAAHASTTRQKYLPKACRE